MLKNIFRGIVGLAILGIFLITGCSKSTTLVINPGEADTTTIYFSKDITPIFEKNCALSGCHVAGGKVPNLTTGVAYQSLQEGSYIVPYDPDNSPLMQWLNGKKSPIMPLGTGPIDSINTKIYSWINQGAKNN